jgi:riboflavin kinase/FMN adenylyltransferase
MKIIHNLEQLHEISKASALALGTFDGIHTAHQKVIRSMVDYANAANLLSVVFTFKNHPKQIKPGVDAPKLLITPVQKKDIIESLGVDVLIIVPFDEHLMSIDPKEFIEKILIEQIKAKHITVGYDYKFGQYAKGDVDLLKSYSDYDLNIIDPIMLGHELVSSTAIREHLRMGQVHEANLLLGRTYCIKGKVIKGKQVGRKLGFPTINLETEFEMSVLKPGVYITRTEIEGEIYPSVTNVGFNPTFNQEDFNIETYILNYDRDLYGFTVKVIFEEYIRPEIKFDSLEELMAQIDHDVVYAKKYFGI